MIHLKLISIFFILAMNFVASSQHLASKNDILMVQVKQALLNPDQLINWSGPPIQLSQYTPYEIEFQQKINESTDALITYDFSKKPDHWTALDDSEITPYNWKWVDFQIIHPLGNSSEFSLRRPNWWIDQIGADKVGNMVFIDMPEMGINGQAKVMSIRVNQLDTRLWNDSTTNNYRLRPITGKFVHHTDTILNLFFSNSNKPIGVTHHHQFWSSDRNDWVSADHLKLGENVKSKQRECHLVGKGIRVLNDMVYNLEVYRDHNYQVSLNNILVHNECWNDWWRILRDDILDEIRMKKEIGAEVHRGLFAISDYEIRGPIRFLYIPSSMRKDGLNALFGLWKGIEQDAWRLKKNKVIIKADITDLDGQEVEVLKHIAVGRGYQITGNIENIKHGANDTHSYLTFEKTTGKVN